jgi:hypothetical protein
MERILVVVADKPGAAVARLWRRHVSPPGHSFGHGGQERPQPVFEIRAPAPSKRYRQLGTDATSTI